MRFTQKKERCLWQRIVVSAILLISLAVIAPAQPSSDSSTDMTMDEYAALCEEVTISELTEHANDMSGRQVAITGEILVWEERETDEMTMHLIVAVDDPAKTLPSGRLPVYIVYSGSIMSFIYDTISVYGTVAGYDEYESVYVEKATLPRIDAVFIDE